MNTEDLLKKVHRIEIKAKRLSQNVFAGQYHSAFKGKGMTFSEVREYTYGDDIRNIDWNVTARNNHPYVKIFEEERELTVVLMIDVSGSTLFGSENNLKSEVITEIAAVLAFSAVNNNDKVGAILFSDKVEKYIPPKKGLSHILAVIRELLTFKRTNSKTDFSSAFMFLSNVIKKHSTCFLITDGFGKFDDSLHIAARKHDLSCLFVNDKKEFNLSNMGLVQFTDAENGNSLWIDTSDRQTRENFKNYRIQQQNDNMNELTKYGIDNVQMLCGEDYIKQLVKLFAKRERR
ncbi:MAG: DUF58 domain-containing protein [Bacteroidales bacterium]|jgi:uncharacterized protein (DUF58 family)|nr:DUF58 domain-containing protein [Bacteroidales bacterium]MBO7180943.1 DUF58 domain-containing protein [Bacteroidales bacterium]MBO7229394.1 DUF58 domain-containing protein [Bacteroidales bacterium]MBQ2303566.1 DUF58 domain-containing protein [Bacteroidales bacterium]MBQ2386610.1 DUF58 domain-containing protein [Bacteroidales bacterium]